MIAIRPQRYILRGTLVQLHPDGWLPIDGRPGCEAQYAVLEVHCALCDRTHSCLWNPRYDGRTYRRSDQRLLFTGNILTDVLLGEDDFCVPSGFDCVHISVLRRTDPGFSAHCTLPGRAIVRRVARRGMKMRCEPGRACEPIDDEAAEWSRLIAH